MLNLMNDFQYSVKDFKDPFINTTLYREVDTNSIGYSYLDKKVIFTVNHLGFEYLSPMPEIEIGLFSNMYNLQPKNILEDFNTLESKQECFQRLIFNDYIESQTKILNIYKKLGIKNTIQKKIKSSKDLYSAIHYSIATIRSKCFKSGISDYFIVIDKNLLEKILNIENFVYNSSNTYGISKIGNLNDIPVFISEEKENFLLIGKKTNNNEPGVIFFHTKREVFSISNFNLSQSLSIVSLEIISEVGFTPEDNYVIINYE